MICAAIPGRSRARTPTDMMRNNMRRIVLWAVLLTLVLAGCAVNHPQEVPEAKIKVELMALNVGKADAILITIEDRNYLVDTGTKDGYDDLERMLKANGASHLQGVFLTHTDKDHGGGMKKLSESDIQVDAWYASAIYHEKDAEDHQAIKAAKKRRTEVCWLSAGDTLDIGYDCRFEILGPLTPDTGNENNNSLVMRLVTPEGNALLTGDMEHGAEERLLRSGADISAVYLKVGHHGRYDATGAVFAKAVSPDVAVISTYTPDQPDSPSEEVIRTLNAVGATVYVTQDNGEGVRVALRGGHAVVIP